jgi:hypothetical protein
MARPSDGGAGSWIDWAILRHPSGTELSFGAAKPATHRRPKPATVWGVLDGRILLFEPFGKGRDQVAEVVLFVASAAEAGVARRFPVGALAGFGVADGSTV